MNNLSSYCGIVDARISASEKDLHKTPLIGAHLGFIGLHTSLQKNYYNLQLSSHLACERIKSCKSMKPFDSFGILQGKYVHFTYLHSKDNTLIEHRYNFETVLCLFPHFF